MNCSLSSNQALTVEKDLFFVILKQHGQEIQISVGESSANGQN